jgi:cytochrome c biogenesis factor
LNLYPGGSEPIGSPSIQRGAVWDLYSSVIALQDNGRSATFRFYRNPGVSWLWLGGAVMALGGLAAAWPGGRRRRPTTRPAEEEAAGGRSLAEVGSA